jgi:multicomponent Na+:H+ antiporter subunit D
MEDLSPIVALSIPAIGAFVIAATGGWPNLREAATLVTGILLFWYVNQLYPIALEGMGDVWQLVEIAPGLALEFQVEPLGMLFSLIASGLWIVTSCYSIGYMRGHHEKHQTSFYVCFAVAISAAMGVAFASNLITLFLCYEMLTISTYPLVTHHRTPEALRAGRVYLGLLLTTSVGFLLLAVIWTWVLTGTLEFRPGGILAGKADEGIVGALLALYVFGTGKAAVMPFHSWLPAAMVAPTPVSALLHAVAVVKAGVFTVLKIAVYVFGLDLLRATPASTILAWIAAATIVVASLVALTKDGLKERLAYSTVAQLSYIVLGALLAEDRSVIGGSMHIATHAFGKITLFFCAGAIMVACHKTKLSEISGIARKMPFTIGAFLVGSFSVIGLPPFGGAWSKYFLVLGAAEAEQTWLMAVLMLGSLLSLANLIPIALRAIFGAPPGGTAHGPEAIEEAPGFCLLAIGISTAGCVGMFLLADDVYRLLAPIVGG